MKLWKFLSVLMMTAALAFALSGCPAGDEDTQSADDKEQGAWPETVSPTSPFSSETSAEKIFDNDAGCFDEITVAAGTLDGTNIPAFKMIMTETTYDHWYPIKAWAEAYANYTFANGGNNGAGTGAVTSEKLGFNEDPWAGKWPYSHSDGDKPVTNVNLRDAMVWCNALSEATGKSPVYRNSNGSILKDATKAVEEFVDPGQMAGKNGYRLLTVTEWVFASKKLITNLTEHPNAEGGTAGWHPGTPANTGSQSDAGYVDVATTDGALWMTGNAWEWCYNTDKTFGLMGGDIYSYNGNGTGYDWQPRPNTLATLKGNLTSAPAVSFRVRLN
ncbi:MAG: formylglycine-generating enzyme family protein [Treponema sp.]|nr:formylglycine-generating enzyme family protein [Treponema sp.]